MVRYDRTRYAGYVRYDYATLISDYQTVDQYPFDLDYAKNAQKAAAIDDQKKVHEAEDQVTTALDDQSKGDLADQQAVAAARNDVDNAEAQVAQQVAAKGVQEERPKN